MKKHVIVVPGLGDNALFMQFALNSWVRSGLILHIHLVPWKGKEQLFAPKLERLLQKIDMVYKENGQVSLIGTSAGASAVMNAFCLRKEKINKVINICGRLHQGKDVTPSLHNAAKGIPAFRESVLLFEHQEKILTPLDKKKILTIRPLYDERVPTETVALKGAENQVIPSVEHILSIGLALTVFRNKILNFLQQ